MIEEDRGGVIHRWVIEVKASNAIGEKLRADQKEYVRQRANGERKHENNTDWCRDRSAGAQSCCGGMAGARPKKAPIVAPPPPVVAAPKPVETTYTVLGLKIRRNSAVLIGILMVLLAVLVFAYAHLNSLRYELVVQQSEYELLEDRVTFVQTFAARMSQHIDREGVDVLTREWEYWKQSDGIEWRLSQAEEVDHIELWEAP